MYNDAFALQLGGDNTSTQTQSNEGNEAKVLQGVFGGEDLGAYGNTATQYQDGMYNWTKTDQDGDKTHLLKNKMVYGNWSKIHQYGDGNTATQKQVDDYDFAEIDQHGDDNTGTQNQFGILNLG